MMGVILFALYAKKVDMALGIVRCCAPTPAHSRTRHAQMAVRRARSFVGLLIPTYYVHNSEVPFKNWLLGSVSPLSASKGEVLTAIWTNSPNTSKFDEMQVSFFAT